MLDTLRRHWPEYLIEAALLGAFMLSASAFALLLEHPASPVRRVLLDAFARRLLMGLAMGTTAIALIYSPLGMRSGAHINPAVTISFFHLGKVTRVDAAFYVLSQFLGASAGMLLAGLSARGLLADPHVNHVVTLPGPLGAPTAFVAELVISFVLMLVVLWSSATPSLERFTGLFAGALLAAYIAVESPLSGTSMNPARSFGSALSSGVWLHWWIYAVAPVVGMLAAAEVYAHLRGAPHGGCAKLHHANALRCIFCGANS